MMLVLYQHEYKSRPTCKPAFYSTSLLKQYSMSLQLGHIILIHSQQIFALTPLFCVFSGEAANTNQGLNLKINRTGDEHTNHYTTDAVMFNPR